MHQMSRRSLLGASLAALATRTAAAQQPPPATLPATPPATPTIGGDDAAFQPNTLFLTWHRDPTTTMTVQWVGTAGETADTAVYYRDATRSLVGRLAPHALPLGSWETKATVARPYPTTDFKVFRAELAGLAPGTDYEFRIGKRSPVYRFRTMPARATDAIHFVTGGDCGVNAHAVANNVQAARQDPMFAVVGGDLGYDNGRSVEVSLAFIRNYSRHMVGRDGRLIPLVTCIGNHEVDGGYGKTREKAPFFYALFDGLYPDTGYATLDFGDYLSLVLLDTGHTSAIAGDQTDWLDRALRARRDHPNVMVVGHVPAYPSYRKAEGTGGKLGTGEGNRKHWVPLFDKYRVPVVLEHHDHTFKRSKPLLGGLADDDGVLYLGDGSWGRLRPPQSPDKLPYLAATSGDYHLTLHRLQGRERFHMALDENGRVMDVCRTGQRKSGAVRAGG
ncbi:metallophosphoesterase : Phosphodiesterase/alkaline phosphatase D OS=Singulisphaera acidiphila (strain ATCC BAA-1392 / DSM 18658 / VKM B-2454 / MOB10) GN=Sinac_6436 PE=4 SV=1: Metallophos [Gemmataceae bacterium]|nr:metallophosphoesterase : Phosphodiesterase/alkaline phosphatase D OS=Singulisphaera acidiphila (strain ATCC BAA-1392 / DSM 18658 / VKM B-2454 / MOB10) GN=Sinac_6436 PE=4 SV=1: Metallophos [Gemmataceae bacterium]VTT99642.1 metallophosphoesterase : Phosphodiesterase/alkaline phosphatase D OS=Singulisphaera acidiphila (strain ATCC BAA-1392 / DSM 18658 / VKM B-2454 / MOB10) GN=Sinac_6436 PE=4 SV=1: Metallophos [Gemmataceae bacterium]